MSKSIFLALPFSLSLLLPSFARAEEMEIFSADKVCTLMPGGLYYSLPCHVEDVELASAALGEVPKGSTLTEFRFIEHLELTLTCDSLGPVAIAWTYGAQSGEIAAGQPFVVDFPTGFEGEKWIFSPKLGLDDIQGFSPGCSARVTSQFRYLDPLAFQLAGNLLYRMDRTLGLIFDSVTPDEASLDLQSEIESGLNALEIIELTAADDSFVNDQITAVKTSLLATQEALSVACGAGSDVELCKATEAKAREVIFLKRKELNADYLELKDYAAKEILRLAEEGESGKTVAKSLQEILVKLK